MAVKADKQYIKDFLSIRIYFTAIASISTLTPRGRAAA
jgi:hypothetical protein